MYPVIVVHGGAGDIATCRIQGKLKGVEQAAKVGSSLLLDGKPAVDAVIAAVKVMEDCPYFNAGTGSVLNLNGEVEMDALLMEGKNINAGSVTGVRGIKNPIELARLVMEQTPHVMLAGEGANQFARRMGIERIPEYQLVTPYEIEALEKFLHPGEETGWSYGDVGTVGAVAIDSQGNFASATSTGGITGKYPGRVGDTPLIGCGGYADNDIGAVSATGTGEGIMRVALSQRIIHNIEMGKTAQEATKAALLYMKQKTGLPAGAITLSKKREIGIFFTSKRMAWSYKQGAQDIRSGIDSPPELYCKQNGLEC